MTDGPRGRGRPRKKESQCWGLGSATRPCPGHPTLVLSAPPTSSRMTSQQRPWDYNRLWTSVASSTSTLSLTSQSPQASEPEGASGWWKGWELGGWVSRLWGPGGIRGTLLSTPHPGARPAGITGWTAPGMEARAGAAAEAPGLLPPRHPPSPPYLQQQPPDHPPFQGWGTGLKHGLPQSLYPGGWGMQTRQVQAGVPPLNS